MSFVPKGVNGTRTPCDRVPDNPTGQDQMCLEGSLCNLCIQRSTHQTFRCRGGQRMVPHRLTEDLAFPAHFHSPCFGSSSKVNELCEPADCQSACLDVKCLCEAIAQVDRDPSARQMLQLFLSMLRQRATYGCPSGQDRKADG